MSARKVVQCVVTGVDAEGHSVIESALVLTAAANTSASANKLLERISLLMPKLI